MYPLRLSLSVFIAAVYLAVNTTLSGCTATASQDDATLSEQAPAVVFVDRASSDSKYTHAPALAQSSVQAHTDTESDINTESDTDKLALMPIQSSATPGIDTSLKKNQTAAITCAVEPGTLQDNLERLSSDHAGKPVVWNARFDVPIDVPATIEAESLSACMDRIIRSVQASQVAIRAHEMANAIVIEER